MQWCQCSGKESVWLALWEQWCSSCGGGVDATMVMGLLVLVRLIARSVISISFSMFIIISDTLQCLRTLNDSPLLYYNNYYTHKNAVGKTFLEILLY